MPSGLVVAFQVYADGVRSGTRALEVQPMLPWLSMITQFCPPYEKSPSAVNASSMLPAFIRPYVARISNVVS